MLNNTAITKRTLALFIALMLICTFTLPAMPVAHAAGTFTATGPSGNVAAGGGTVNITWSVTGYSLGTSIMVSATVDSPATVTASDTQTTDDTNGDASGTIIVTIPDNQLPTERQFSVTLSSDAGGSTVTITQDGTGLTASLTPVTNPIAVDAAGGTPTIQLIVANYPQAVVSVSNSGGLSITPQSQTAANNNSSTVAFSVTVPQNTSAAKTYNVSFTSPAGDTTVIINQAAAATPTLTVSPSAINIGAAAGSPATFTVTTANFPAGSSVSIPAVSGLSISPTTISGSSLNKSVTVTVSALSANTSKTATIPYTITLTPVNATGAPTRTVSVTQAAVQPDRPVLVSGQAIAPGGYVTISSYVKNSNESYYIGTSNNVTNVSSLTGVTYTSSTKITVGTGVAAGTYYLYLYNTATGQLSLASANYFTIMGGALTRPVVTSGQSVKQGGTLKIENYVLPATEQFVVALSTSSNKTYYVCTATTGTTITTVTLPGSLAEGTYNLYARNISNTAQLSTASANVFTVDNTAPSVSATSPSNSAANISPSSSFSITFSEPMDTTVGTISIKNNDVGADPSVSKAVWTNSSKTATYTLTGLLSNTRYTVTIYYANATNITAFTDAAGNLLKSTSTVSFTTGNAATYGNGESVINIHGVTTTSGSTATTVIDESSFDIAVTQAVKDEGNGYSPNILLTVGNDLPSNATTANINISSSALYDASRRTDASLTINAGHLGTMSFDSSALSTIVNSGSGTVVISTTQRTAADMSLAVRNAVGSNPAYDFKVTVGSRTISSFGSGRARITMPYTLSTASNANQVVGYRVSDTGTLTAVLGRYNASSRTFEFRLGSFSTYTIKYSPRSYSDVYSSDWFAAPVEYMAARGLLDVFTTGYSLEPTRKTTRAEFIVMFMQAYGIEPTTYSYTAQFEDVSPTASYAEYVRTARSLGLTNGINSEGTKFGPDELLSREMFFTMTYRALQQLNLMPTKDTGARTSNFMDAAKVSTWAYTATEALIRTGVIKGDGTNINPLGDLTRAEITQAVYRLVTEE